MGEPEAAAAGGLADRGGLGCEAEALEVADGVEKGWGGGGGMRTRHVNIMPPMGGLRRDAGFQEHPPYATPECRNVRPYDAFSMRARLGSRSGLEKAASTRLGGGSPVNMLAELPVMADSGHKAWRDDFRDEELGEMWSDASWLPARLQLLPASKAIAGELHPVTGGVLDAFEDLEADQPHSVDILIEPYDADSYGSVYTIFLRMDDSAPDASQDGVLVELQTLSAAGEYSARIRKRTGGETATLAFSSQASATQVRGWFSAYVSGDTVSAVFDGTEVATADAGSAAGGRIGLGLNCGSDTRPAALVDAIRVRYFGAGAEQRDLLLAASGGALYAEALPGRLEEVESDTDLMGDRLILSAPRLQKLFIADWGEANAAGTDGTIGGASNNQLSASGISDWTALDIDTDSDSVEIYNTLGSISGNDGTYSITSVVAGYIVVDNDFGGTGSCSYRISRAPKVYDGASGELSVWEATAGTVPANCPLICVYSDRVWLAGSVALPNMWAMSRQGDPFDWDFSAEGAQAAIYGPASTAGQIGGTLTALAPHTDDYLLMASRTTLWAMVGDPGAGGGLTNVSQTVGVVGRGAWTRTPDGHFVFLSHDGLYALAPGGRGTPQSLSRERCPQELINVDTSLRQPLMEYDAREQCVRIYNARNSGGGGTLEGYEHWAFHWPSGTFWPDTHGAAHRPHSVLGRRFLLTGGDLTLVVGSMDGYVRGYSLARADDDGAEVLKQVTLGPFEFGRAAGAEAIASGLDGIVDERSDYVRFDVRAGATMQSVLSESPLDWGYLYASEAHGMRQRSAGRAAGACHAIELTSAGRFAVERLSAQVALAGRARA